MEGHKPIERISRGGWVVLNFRKSQGRAASRGRILSLLCSQSCVPWGCMFPEQVLFQVPSKASPELEEALLGTWVRKDSQDVKHGMPADLLKVLQIQNH